jgi:Arc/MetJ family transcription regulator
MGRFTTTVDDKLLDEAQRVMATRNKRETIEAALREAIRRDKIRKALEHKGKLPLGFSRKQLLDRREKS